MQTRTYFVVKTSETGAPLFSSDYSRFNDEKKDFPTQEAALEYIRNKYAGHKRAHIYVDGENGEAIPVGWVIGFRNSDISHVPVETWNQQDWVELVKVTEEIIEF